MKRTGGVSTARQVFPIRLEHRVRPKFTIQQQALSTIRAHLRKSVAKSLRHKLSPPRFSRRSLDDDRGWSCLRRCMRRISWALAKPCHHHLSHDSRREHQHRRSACLQRSVHWSVMQNLRRAAPPPAHHNLRSLVVKHHPSHRRLHTIAAPEFYPTPTRNPNLFSASSAQTLRIRDETLCTILSQPLLFRSSEAKFSPTPNSIIGRWVAFSYTRWTNYYLANPPSGAIMPANYLQSLTLLSGCKIPARPPASHKRGDSV